MMNDELFDHTIDLFLRSNTARSHDHYQEEA
jgi:hypothetical protein